jgi:hypothetical protein
LRHVPDSYALLLGNLHGDGVRLSIAEKSKSDRDLNGRLLLGDTLLHNVATHVKQVLALRHYAILSGNVATTNDAISARGRLRLGKGRRRGDKHHRQHRRQHHQLPLTSSSLTT